jgi:hypothetical protein
METAAAAAATAAAAVYHISCRVRGSNSKVVTAEYGNVPRKWFSHSVALQLRIWTSVDWIASDQHIQPSNAGKIGFVICRILLGVGLSVVASQVVCSRLALAHSL